MLNLLGSAPATHLINVIALDITYDAVHAVRSIVNPDKLRHLGPLGGINALMRRP